MASTVRMWPSHPLPAVPMRREGPRKAGRRPSQPMSTTTTTTLDARSRVVGCVDAGVPSAARDGVLVMLPLVAAYIPFALVIGSARAGPRVVGRDCRRSGDGDTARLARPRDRHPAVPARIGRPGLAGCRRAARNHRRSCRGVIDYSMAGWHRRAGRRCRGQRGRAGARTKERIMTWVVILAVGAGSFVFRLGPLLAFERITLGERGDRLIRNPGTAALTPFIVAPTR